MDKLLINGGNKIKGTVKISGSKNASLPVLIATLLTDEPCTITNVPELYDINTCISILEYFGKKIIRSKNTVKVMPGPIKSYTAPYELIKKMRASFLVTGPLLARYGKIKASLPGGCAIGVRPVNIHIDGFIKFGAKAGIKQGYVNLSHKKLHPAKVNLQFPSVGATENLIMFAALIEGDTTITNAACEPEIIDLADFLNSIGANIKGAGTPVIHIHGVPELHGTAGYKVIPDRIEAGTYLIGAAITGGELLLTETNYKHLQVLLDLLTESGSKISYDDTSIRIKSGKKIKPVNITTQPYPGFPTDLQAQWMVLMCLAEGQSILKETVFENRFMHVPELQRLGAKLIVKNDTVIIEGKSNLTGAQVMVSDLRAGAALVLAGLAARGKTVISHIYHLDRGYENLVAKLRKINVKIKRDVDN